MVKNDTENNSLPLTILRLADRTILKYPVKITEFHIATGNSFNPNETPLYTVMDADGKKATFGTELTGK